MNEKTTTTFLGKFTPTDTAIAAMRDEYMPMNADQRHERIANDIRDYIFGLVQFQAEQFRLERQLSLRPMPADHYDVPGDFHEREFVKAMRQDGVMPLRQREEEEAMGHA